MSFRFLAALAVSVLVSLPAQAAQCGGDFRGFLAGMARDAEAAGVSRNIVETAFAGLTPDSAVIAFDHRQRGTFRMSFEAYSRTRVTAGRIAKGRAVLKRDGSMLARIEQRYGVPAEVIVAIWGLETDFGVGDMGRRPVIRTLATLAHDCRRTQLFQGELIAALKILQRGDLRASDMVGAFAGEIGQTQFLPSSYIKYGVDFNGDGRVDLRHTPADVLASTANLLHSNGWHRGQPYDPGTANFDVMREWNRADVYRRTIVLFAHKLAQ